VSAHNSGAWSGARVEEAAQILVAARNARRRIEGLPESCRPPDLESGLAIQQKVTDLLSLPIGAWKCALSPPEKVFVAPIFAPAIHFGSVCPALVHGAPSASAEPEIAFVLGRDLPPRSTAYGESEIREAIAETRLVLEILGGRYIDSQSRSFPELLADGLMNQGLFIGPVLPNALDRPLDSFPIKIEGSGGFLLERDGRHPTGHPFPPLVWLVGFLNGRGQGLRRGQIVTTGSYAGVLDLPLGVPLRVTFGDLGVLAVQFAPADASPAAIS